MISIFKFSLKINRGSAYLNNDLSGIQSYSLTMSPSIGIIKFPMKFLKSRCSRFRRSKSGDEKISLWTLSANV